MKPIILVVLIVVASINTHAKSWQLGIRTGQTKFYSIGSIHVNPNYRPIYGDRSALETEIYARKEHKNFAIDYSVGHYKTINNFSGYAFVFDAPNYFYNINTSSDNVSLSVSAQYDLLALVKTKSKTHCYFGLAIGLENIFSKVKETHILDLDSKPEYNFDYHVYDILPNATAVLYISHNLNSHLVLNLSSSFSANSRALYQGIKYYYTYNDIDSRLSTKIGIGYKL